MHADVCEPVSVSTCVCVCLCAHVHEYVSTCACVCLVGLQEDSSEIEEEKGWSGKNGGGERIKSSYSKNH